MVDKRRDPRHPVKVPVVLTLNAKEFTGILEDLSLGGARVRIPGLASTRVGSVVTLAATLPPSARVSLKARVVWEKNGEWGLSLEGPPNPRVVGFCRIGVERAQTPAR